MDTTPEYIKMCEKAKKIQRKFILEFGDLLWDTHSKELAIVSDEKLAEGFSLIYPKEGKGYRRNEPVNFDNNCLLGFTFLPRQDQLQGMVGDTPIQSLNFFIKFWWEAPPDIIVARKFKTLEQHWLGYVMKEKYNKKWNGEKWIK